MRKFYFLFVLSLILFLVSQMFAQIPRTLSYQGVIDDSSTLLPDGEHVFTFFFYNDSTGGKAIWSEHQTLEVKHGLISTVLGNETPFPDSMKFDQQYWLAISCDRCGIMSPRIRLTSVGYSMNALRADTAKISLSSVGDGPWLKSDSGIYYDGHNVGIGTSMPSGNLHIAENTSVFKVVLNQKNVSFLRFGDQAVDNKASAKIEFAGWGIRHGGLSFIPRDTSNNLSKFFFSMGGNDDPEKQSRYLTIQYGGNIGIGTTTPSAKLDVAGRTKTQTLEITGGSDLAEPFPISDETQLSEGSVVVIDKSNPGHLTLSKEPYDKKVAGVVSGAGGVKPGLTLKQEGLMEGDQNIALSGRVYVKAVTTNGAIVPGDLLTTSSLPGRAMKATDKDKSFGTIIGKAMSSLDNGEGLVLVLVNLQ
jgi:hypothetical protein